MNNYGITEQEEFRKERLEQLRSQARWALKDAATDRDIAIGAAYVSAVMGILAVTGEYTAHKWGVKQDIECAIGGFTLGIAILETGISKMNKRQAAEILRTAEQSAAANEISD